MDDEKSSLDEDKELRWLNHILMAVGPYPPANDQIRDLVIDELLQSMTRQKRTVTQEEIDSVKESYIRDLAIGQERIRRFLDVDTGKRWTFKNLYIDNEQVNHGISS